MAADILHADIVLKGGRVIDASGRPAFAADVAALVGHSTLRVQCVKDLSRPATAAERAQMNLLLREALDEGALGMSSGVFYAPAQAADVEELEVLARTVSQVGGVYTAHIRDE